MARNLLSPLYLVVLPGQLAIPRDFRRHGVSAQPWCWSHQEKVGCESPKNNVTGMNKKPKNLMLHLQIWGYSYPACFEQEICFLFTPALSSSKAEGIVTAELRARRQQPDRPIHRPTDSLFSWTKQVSLWSLDEFIYVCLYKFIRIYGEDHM